MNSKLITISVLVVLAVIAAPLYLRHKKQADEMKRVDTLIKQMENDGKSKGVIDADRDFSNGVYQVKVYGLRAVSKKREDYLEKQYNLKSVVIAGCCVSSEEIGYADAYNSRMEDLLRKKLGKDIFKEAEESSADDSSVRANAEK